MTKKSVSKSTKSDPTSISSPSSGSVSPWTEGDIPRRKGNCNVLLVAPHGHPDDDTNTAKLARKLADLLDCYAVINEKYQKPSNAGYTKSNLRGYAIDLNNWREAKKLKKTKSEFFDIIKNFKQAILKTGNPALLVHVHGIKNKNLLLVAKKIKKL